MTPVPEPTPALRALGGAGPVMLIGGAEDKVRDKLILSRFATFAGGPDGHVAVIATASVRVPSPRLSGPRDTAVALRGQSSRSTGP